MADFLNQLLSTDGFMPHGMCYEWNPIVIWLHVISDAFIALAYYSIPFTLIYFVRKRKDLTFGWIFICFGVFILACGTTHVMEIINIWYPVYWLSGVIKVVTAIASVGTAILLVRLLPQALGIPSLMAVQKAEEKFRGLLESAPDGTVIVDSSGEIVLVNAQAEKLFGYPRNELQGKKVDVLIPERSQVQGPAPIQEDSQPASNRYTGSGVDLFGRRRDGTEFPVEISLGALETEDGKLISRFIRDISERKKVEQAIRDQAIILDEVNDTVFTRDASDKITYWNHAAQRIYGWSQEEVLGQVSHDLLKTRFPCPLAEIEEKLLAEGHWEGELIHTRRDGTSFTVSSRWTMQWGKDKRPLGVIEMNNDISERKRYEQTLADKNLELEAANKELEAFSYSVSHDLRAPLRAMDGFSQALVEDYGPQLPSECQHYLKTIREGAQRMGMLIDDLLAFSRLGRAPLNKRTVDTASLFRSSLEDLSSDSRGREIDIQIGDLPTCQADSALLKQVWVNLLSNAIKYTRGRSPARIEIGCKSDKENVFFVRDNGAGFDMLYAHKLFGVFQRLHRADEFEGTGVGLAIVQRIIHRHGGHIWAEAAVNRGATFYFTLKDELPL